MLISVCCAAETSIHGLRVWLDRRCAVLQLAGGCRCACCQPLVLQSATQRADSSRGRTACCFCTRLWVKCAHQPGSMCRLHLGCVFWLCRLITSVWQEVEGCPRIPRWPWRPLSQLVAGRWRQSAAPHCAPLRCAVWQCVCSCQFVAWVSSVAQGVKQPVSAAH